MHAYAQARLRLSALYMLSIWLLALTLLLLHFSSWTQAGSPVLPQWAFLIFWGMYVAISLPFDFMGGWFLPHKYGRHTMQASAWWLEWVRAIGLQGVVFGAATFFLIIGGRWLGIGGALGAFFLLQMLLTGLQLFIARGLTPLPAKVESDRGVWVYMMESQDRSFSGGIFGMPGQEYIVLPTYWREKFSEKVFQMLLDRRHGAINTGSHGRGVLLALLINTALFAAALWLAKLEPQDGWWIIEVSLLFTVLATPFYAIVMPWLSRRGVYEVDRWAYYKGLDADILRASFDQTHRLQEDYGAKGIGGGWLQPTPTLQMRRDNLASQKPVKGAWQSTRHAVFTSWGGLNLLARALPPQIGRPALWVFLPGD